MALKFASEDALTDCRAQVRALAKEFRTDRRPVWIDMQKSPAELKPMRQLNRAERLIRGTFEGKGSTAVVEVVRGGFRRIKISGEVIGTVGGQGLSWTDKAKAHLGNDELEEIKEMVNSS